jgi:hypothetical protein
MQRKLQLALGPKNERDLTNNSYRINLEEGKNEKTIVQNSSLGYSFGDRILVDVLRDRAAKCEPEYWKCESEYWKCKYVRGGSHAEQCL